MTIGEWRERGWTSSRLRVQDSEQQHFQPYDHYTLITDDVGSDTVGGWWCGGGNHVTVE